MARNLAWGVLVFVCLAAPATAFASHDEPLRGQWHLDTKTPGPPSDLTLDSSGHGLGATTATGTLVLGPDGRFGDHLTAANASVLRAGPSSLLQPQQLTLLAWVRHNAVPVERSYIAGQGDDGGTCLGSSYGLYTGLNIRPGLTFFIRSGSTGSFASPAADSSLWDGGWHLVAGTFDGSAVRLYVDGIQVGEGTQTDGGPINYALSGGSSDFYIGGYPVPACASPGVTGDFPGGIDEVRVYSRALNRSELRRMAIHPGSDPPALQPDQDDDFVPDSIDNCLTTPNPDQRDGDGNGIGDGCEGPLVPRFIYAAQPACVGGITQFNATHASAGANGPIVNYRWEYTEPVPYLTGSWGRIKVSYYYETIVIADGPSATPTHRFWWNRQDLPYLSDPGTLVIPPGERDPVFVRLTLTDSAGGTASIDQLIDFDRETSHDPIGAHCPPDPPPLVFAPTPTSIDATAKRVVVQTSCQSGVTCSGAALTTLLSGKTAFAAGKRQRVTILGRAPFLIPAGEKASIRVPLNLKAKRLLERRGKLRARVTLYSVNAEGDAEARSRRVTIE